MVKIGMVFLSIMVLRKVIKAGKRDLILLWLLVKGNMDLILLRLGRVVFLKVALLLHCPAAVLLLRLCLLAALPLLLRDLLFLIILLLLPFLLKAEILTML